MFSLLHCLSPSPRPPRHDRGNLARHSLLTQRKQIEGKSFSNAFKSQNQISCFVCVSLSVSLCVCFFFLYLKYSVCPSWKFIAPTRGRGSTIGELSRDKHSNWDENWRRSLQTPVFKGAESRWNVERRLTRSAATVPLWARVDWTPAAQDGYADCVCCLTQNARLSHADGPSRQASGREWRLINQFRLPLAVCRRSNYQFDNGLIQITWQTRSRYCRSSGDKACFTPF